MSGKTALKIILVISIAGLLFSGFLSYRELFLGDCDLGFVSCGTKTGPIFGLPACVYGFVMYLIVFVVSFLGLRSKK
ncbi:hypothetical protein A2165_03135 [Candidatus Curtissbacteria bacterium RBG_13_40_7]|uniref:Vitamin K epoxide reductase domain-containing protein n=1 Tax=Candidatus Curtissbacteria bacterium RBG_13_40_7 TaxID=1797706 RepID=A0A1F5FYP5_9BACT|nr:MAG: hypothetical protein A2165_03135 [Candidatus Curtissbacteria bacterium RBG_13_40_7]